jgi:hypothetical protein
MKKVLLVLALLLSVSSLVFAEDAKPQTGYDNGFFVQSADGNFKLKFNANMQLRYEYQVVELGRDINTFAFPRTRLILTGNAFTPKLTYMFMPEMGDYDQTHTSTGTGTTANLYMRDLWFDYAFSPKFQIKLGQFFLPRHRQASTVSTAQQFGEFPITALSDFTFTWDRGVDFHGSIGKLDYDAVLTNGSGGGLANVSRGMNIGTRLVYNIFGKYGYTESDIDCSESPNLAVGGHISYNNSDNYNKAATAPGGTGPEYLLASGDIALKYRGFSAEAEFINLHNYVTGLNHPAFTFQGGYFLVPKKWELAGELSYIFWDGTDNDQMEYVAGTSYYFKGHKVKVQATYSLLINEAAIAGSNDQVNHRIRALFGFAF